MEPVRGLTGDRTGLSTRRALSDRPPMASRRRVFKIVLEPAEDEPTEWYTATSPTLPGLVTQGKGLDEAVANVRDAISAYFGGKPPAYSLEVRVVVPV